MQGRPQYRGDPRLEGDHRTLSCIYSLVLTHTLWNGGKPPSITAANSAGDSAPSDLAVAATDADLGLLMMSRGYVVREREGSTAEVKGRTQSQF